MLSAERADFETQLAVLFGGFPTFLTPPRVEAYWRGLSKMQLSVFVRCVDQALGESGTDKLPTVNTLWQISKRLRVPATPQRLEENRKFDPVQGFGQRCLMAFLRRKGGVSDASLQSLLAVKNEILSTVSADVDPTELRDVLMAAFDQRFEAMDAVTIGAHADFYGKHGRIRTTSDSGRAS